MSLLNAQSSLHTGQERAATSKSTASASATQQHRCCSSAGLAHGNARRRRTFSSAKEFCTKVRSAASTEATTAAAIPAAQPRPSAPFAAPCSDLSTALSLEGIRQALIRQEDTIIYNLIERAQFAHNAPVYQPGGVPVPYYGHDGRQYSLLEYLLRATEEVHGKVRRYTSPDEHPFYPDAVPGYILPPMSYPQVLAPYAKSININDKVMALYLDHLLPTLTRHLPGTDDNNYGSAATLDVLCLQALSKRIHYGKFVAEAKFQEQPELYTKLIMAQDADGIMQSLTNREVELKVVERVQRKAAIYGQDSNGTSTQNGANGGGAVPVGHKLDPSLIAELYDRWVMPLTKEVQLAYLQQRCLVSQNGSARAPPCKM